MSVYKVNGTGAGAIATSMTVPSGGTYRLMSVSLNLNVAGTTSNDFTITLDANAGADYDVLLYTADLATAGVTDLVWMPDEPLYLEGGDAVDVAWANSELRTYGVQITMEAV